MSEPKKNEIDMEEPSEPISRMVFLEKMFEKKETFEEYKKRMKKK